ncbi:MAG: hypothetical protein WCX10_05790, partial [Bacteroidales bacterium]
NLIEEYFFDFSFICCKVCKTCEFYLIHSAKISKIYDLTFCLIAFNTKFYLATVLIYTQNKAVSSPKIGFFGVEDSS